MLYCAVIMMVGLYHNKNKAIQKKSVPYDLEDVVYQLSERDKQFQSTGFESRVEAINSEKQAIAFLEHYLTLAKKENESRYIGYAIAGYQKIPLNIKEHHEVLLKYSEILEYQHNFKQALDLLITIDNKSHYYSSAVVKILNIYMIQGNLEQVSLYCEILKENNLLSLYSVCQLWIHGMKEESPGTIKKLEHLFIYFKKNTPIYNWTSQLLMDLYLKYHDVEKAITLLKNSERNEEAYRAMLIQIVDYLLISHQKKQALTLLEQYDDSKDLNVRYCLAKGDFNTKVCQQAQEKIHYYALTRDTAHFFIRALWEKEINHNLAYSKELANTNYESYKTHNNILLMNYLEIEKND